MSHVRNCFVMLNPDEKSTLFDESSGSVVCSLDGYAIIPMAFAQDLVNALAKVAGSAVAKQVLRSGRMYSIGEKPKDVGSPKADSPLLKKRIDDATENLEPFEPEPEKVNPKWCDKCRRGKGKVFVYANPIRTAEGDEGVWKPCPDCEEKAECPT